MAYLSAYLPAHLAIEVHQGLTALAMAQRSAGQTTDPDQCPGSFEVARADVLVEVIRAAVECLESTGGLPSMHGKPRIEVGVIVDLPTLLDLARNPGEILGYGPIDAEYARLLAGSADTWRRWVIEPVTGHLLDFGRTRYKPSQELRDYILAAYPECTRPECDRTAARCDIDHAREWHEAGTTSADNLHVLCRRDHTDKTTGWADARVNRDGTVTHTTRHGLTRTTDSHWWGFAANLTRGRTPDDDPAPF